VRHRPPSGGLTTYDMISVIKEIIARWNELGVLRQSDTKAALLIDSDSR